MAIETPLVTGSVHAASELNDNYRAILDEARERGVARLRDKDGVSILVLPEAQFASVVELTFIADVACSWLSVLPFVEDGLDVLASSGWSWLRWLDLDDRRTFLEEIRQGLIDGIATRDSDTLRRDLRDWQITAETLRDEKAREVLLGAAVDEDYVEAARPGAAEQELARPAPLGA